MVKQIKITDLKDAQNTCNNHAAVISIGSGSDWLVYPKVPVLHLIMDDIPYQMQFLDGSLGIVPKEEHVRKAIDFAKNHDDILIHCFAGVSRSSGMALAIFMDEYLNHEKAYDKVIEIRDCARPNLSIIKHIQNIFGINDDALLSYIAENQAVKDKTFRENYNAIRRQEEVNQMKDILKILNDY